MHLGDLTVANQEFLALDALPETTAFQAFEGVLGLGFPNDTNDAAVSVFQVLSFGIAADTFHRTPRLWRSTVPKDWADTDSSSPP